MRMYPSHTIRDQPLNERCTVIASVNTETGQEAMTENKTRPTSANALDFLDAVAQEARRF